MYRNTIKLFKAKLIHQKYGDESIIAIIPTSNQQKVKPPELPTLLPTREGPATFEFLYAFVQQSFDVQELPFDSLTVSHQRIFIQAITQDDSCNLLLPEGIPDFVLFQLLPTPKNQKFLARQDPHDSPIIVLERHCAFFASSVYSISLQLTLAKGISSEDIEKKTRIYLRYVDALQSLREYENE